MHFLKKTKEKFNGEQIIFHASQKEGLDSITPNKCKHSSAYVYASLNLPLCVIFSVKRTSENIAFGVGKLGKPFIQEFYEGAFEDRFKNQKTFIYKLPLKEFKQETEFLEMVCSKPVKVLDCLTISDCASYLLELEKKRQVKIYRYNKMSKSQKQEVHNKLIKALKKYTSFTPLSSEEFSNLSDFDKHKYLTTKERYDNCCKQFPEFMSQLKNNP